jgi:eukaryotic-like serine/threonine-protein kinase
MNEPKQLEKIGRYQILARVGKGGMGVLYRGFDPVLDREVAIKLMLADFSEDAEQMRPRFYREARAAAKLQHRNIVTIFEFAEESNVPYIVMEFLRGTPLGARINTQPPLTIDDKLNIIAQLCDGLSYAHEQGVVHRDVKPDNVFLLEDGSIKLLDFGIAKLTSSTLTRQGDVLGSASYMSPEQVSGGESVDGRADIFSTGVVLYELLAGRKPFVADSPTAVILKILKEDPTPIETLVSDLPPDLVAAVMRALSKDPDQRFATADAFGRELQQIRKSLHPSVSTSQLDETRFASTMVMKALHQDLQQTRTGSKTGTLAGGTKVGAAPPARPAWLIPAGIGAVVVAGIVTFLLMSRSAPTVAANPSAATTANGSLTPAAPGATKTGATTPAAAATPPATNVTPAPPGASNTAPPATAPTATAADPGTPKAPPEPKKAAPVINVNLTGAYAFEVFDGSRAISAASTSHELKQPVGKTLRVSAPKYFLNQSIRVEGATNQPFEFAVPALGSLDVRSSQETCDVLIGTQKLGNPPLLVEIAAGQYKIDLSCGGQVVKTHFATVRAGQTYVAAIR